MRVCSCCYDPVVYPDDISDNLLSTQIVVHDNFPTFEGEKDWTHSLSTRISHEHFEKLGMQYKRAFGDDDSDANKMWHLPDGRVISAGSLGSGVSWCVISKGRVASL